MKLFCCEVETSLYVYAEDHHEARQLAIDHARDEDPDVHVSECDSDHKPWAHWANSIPWGEDRDRTVSQIIATLDVDAAEQKRLAELEALQGKLPFG